MINHDYSRIPNELQQVKRWGLFHLEWKPDRKKYNKRPIVGKSNDPATWIDLSTALKQLEVNPKADGLAFFLGDGLVGLDIDHIKSDLEAYLAGQATDDNLVKAARGLTKNTYIEVSVSGEGIHAIYKGKLTGSKKRIENIEMYDSGRFFALTGNTLDEEPTISTLNDTESARVYDHFLPQPKQQELTPVAPPRKNDLDTATIISKAKAATNGDKFAKLMAGEWEGQYSSQSEADQALANLLAFWTGKDFSKMDTIFRQSRLYRPKYDEKHGQETYGAMTLNKAIADTDQVYGQSSPKSLGDQAAKSLWPNVDTKGFDVAAANKLKKLQDKPDLKAHTWTDDGNAARLIDQFGDVLRYSYFDKRWYFYDGSRWQVDYRGFVEQCVDKIILNMHHEPITVPSGRSEEEIITAWTKFIDKTHSAKSRKAMVENARHLVKVEHGEFDRKPYQLNTATNYIDLKDGQPFNHGPNNMFSQQVKAEFNPAAKAPNWERFLRQIFEGDTELIRFIQTAIGYSATGSTEEQVMFILYGNGRNGKSVFINTLAAVLGTYAKTMDISALMVKRFDGGPSPEIARLEGARLVVTSEANENSRLNEGLVKQATGGDKLSTRFLNADTFEFTPQFKIWMATNHLPSISGTDNGIWRRLVPIKFGYQVPLDKVDKKLKEKLEREASGILNWIIEGAQIWQREGLTLPQSVENTRKHYRQAMDQIEQFINECCVVGNDHSEQASVMYQHYKNWAEDGNEHVMNRTKFGREMAKRFAKEKGRLVFYQGVKLRE